MRVQEVPIMSHVKYVLLINILQQLLCWCNIVPQLHQLHEVHVPNALSRALSSRRQQADVQQKSFFGTSFIAACSLLILATWAQLLKAD